jgi:hypothetical protein
MTVIRKFSISGLNRAKLKPKRAARVEPKMRTYTTSSRSTTAAKRRRKSSQLDIPTQKQFSRCGFHEERARVL